MRSDSYLFLEGLAEAVRVGAAREHGCAAATFKSVAANEIGMLVFQIAEASEIEATGTAIVER